MAAAGISGADEEERSGIETVDFNKDDLLIHPDYIPRNRGRNFQIYLTLVINKLFK